MPNFHSNLEEFCFLAVFGHWKWSYNLILRKLSAKAGRIYGNFYRKIVRVVDFTYTVSSFDMFVKRSKFVLIRPLQFVFLVFLSDDCP